MAPHSRILAWRIPWTQELGGPQSMGSQRVDTTEWLTHTLMETKQNKTKQNTEADSYPILLDLELPDSQTQVLFYAGFSIWWHIRNT